MALKITLKDGNWRVNIESETWEIKTYKEFHEVLDKLISYKDKYGRNINDGGNKQ